LKKTKSFQDYFEGVIFMSKRGKQKKYSKELKLEAIHSYLNGEGGLRTVCRKYGILNETQLRRWVLWYNGHKEFKERTSAKGEIYMTKGRKTTQEERAEIVAFCIEHNYDYGLTVETYGVSYNQIYAWVRKYEEGGVDKLKDNRGRTKAAEEMTEIEKLKAEMKILEAKNRQLEIENEFIKKLQELIGGGQ
jgi:transposase-like protein